MTQLINPILPGFHADPCICRKGDEYYIAVSSFEWFPGIPVYHSSDLQHWSLYTHVLTDDRALELRGMPSAKGIWAPSLTYCEAEDRFYVVYGIMRSMNARYFDVDNYLITAPEITGPWSKPVYLHSAGFDASLLHDDDGRKWLVSLEWETRTNYAKPGAICLVEYDPARQKIIGLPKRIYSGATKRGCLEGPHLTKKNGFYYLMCAEGGTGYYHAVTMARSKNPYGPYEPDPKNPILTSVPEERDEQADTDHLKPRYYNPDVYLQKCGHGSYVTTPHGDTYLVHICARPFVPELRCTLGRETGIQKMKWTKDGWLRLADGGNLARTIVEGNAIPDTKSDNTDAASENCTKPEGTASVQEKREELACMKSCMSDGSETDDFDEEILPIRYYAPRIDPASFTDLTSRPGWLRIRGQQSATSTDRASLLAVKLTSVHTEVLTTMEFTPVVYQHSAGLMLYYDSMNFVYLRKYYSETLGVSAISIVRVRNGEKTDLLDTRTSVPDGPLRLKLTITGRETRFYWAVENAPFAAIGPVFDTGEFSDEYSEFGEFTGAFVGMFCEDRLLHETSADFDFFTVRNLEPDLLLEEMKQRKRGLHEVEQQYHTLSYELHEWDEEHNPYNQELREQESIRRGDLEGFRRSVAESYKGKVGQLATDLLRHMKNTAIVVVTLACRSAIAGGLMPETAFSMSDAMMQKIETAKTPEEAQAFARGAEEAYCLTVRNLRGMTEEPELLFRCRGLIARHLHQKIRIYDLAQTLGVSPDYLSHRFAEVEGISLSDYIMREKCLVAARQLIYTEDSYNQVAQAMGFSSQSHFGKHFKKWMGMTPKRYREFYGGENMN